MEPKPPPRHGRIEPVLTFFSSFEEADEVDRRYWMSLTGLERLAAIEDLRQAMYGYDPDSTRLERVLEVVDLE
jgi:hypothetical protein